MLCLSCYMYVYVAIIKSGCPHCKQCYVTSMSQALCCFYEWSVPNHLARIVVGFYSELLNSIQYDLLAQRKKYKIAFPVLFSIFQCRSAVSQISIKQLHEATLLVAMKKKCIAHQERKGSDLRLLLKQQPFIYRFSGL